jgi:hypothetical protein
MQGSAFAGTSSMSVNGTGPSGIMGCPGDGATRRAGSRRVARSIAAVLALAIAPAVADAQDVREAQAALAEMGCYDGPVDGSRSLAFRTAVRCLQKRAGLQPNGTLDAATLAELETGGGRDTTAAAEVVSGSCRAGDGVIECAVPGGGYAEAAEPRRSVAAEQLVLAALGCFDGAITGVDDTSLVRGLNCAREKTGDLAGFRREVRILLGEITREEAEAEVAAAAAAAPAREPEAAAPAEAALEATGPLEVDAQLIAEVRAGAAALRGEAPAAYAGPVFAGTRGAALYDRIYRGDFDGIEATDRAEAVATHVALLIAHADRVRRFGAECLYAGDAQYRFTLTEEETHAYGGTTRNVYAQDFWSPAAHERVARGAFSAMGVTPGLNVLADMGLVVRREECGSPRTALLRENLFRVQAGLAPAALEEMERLYPRQAAAPASPDAPITDDWKGFALACLQNRQSAFSVYPVAVTAHYCACLERHLRAADVGDIYAAFAANWERGADRYWSSDAMQPILQTCSRSSQEADGEHARELLRMTGAADGPMVIR